VDLYFVLVFCFVCVGLKIIKKYEGFVFFLYALNCIGKIGVESWMSMDFVVACMLANTVALYVKIDCLF
jgi:hypothetical protein